MNKRIRKKREKAFKAAFARALHSVDWAAHFREIIRLGDEITELFKGAAV